MNKSTTINQATADVLSPPMFYDVTLRDGNQALAKPMTFDEKLKVFGWLKELGVRRVEVGFPAASDMDFRACQAIAEQATVDMTIAVLARCHGDDIDRAIEALKYVKWAVPRLHTFVGMSEFHMSDVLQKKPEEVKAMAIATVSRARAELGKEVNRGKISFPREIQFSPEHFGDCQANLDWVIEALQEIVAAGANVINLPNTVERTRPAVFARMVEKVVAALPKSVIVSVHCHDDLGMATATTVESYFKGARQLEVTLNSLGERAGNTSLYETAVALHLAGVPVGINLDKIYETALKVAELTGVPIPAKAPIIGQECLYHRSGIHQHGAHRTLERPKRAYLPFDPAAVGRAGDEQLRFTSQSGYTAVLAIVKEAGHLITEAEARLLQPALKAASETRGELKVEEIVAVYEQYLALKAAKEQVNVEDIMALASSIIHQGEQTWKRVFARAIAGEHPTATISLCRNGEVVTKAALGDGPVDAAFEAIRQITGIEVKIEKYHINNVTPGADSLGKVICGLKLDGRYSEESSTGPDIVMASVDAYLNALNKLVLSGNSILP